MEFYLPYERALEIILSQDFRLPHETVYLPQAYGRVLAEDIRADADSPQAPLSAMDGYAVSSSRTPGSFRVIGEVPAGTLPPLSPEGGEAVKLFTGSFLPSGCDAVVPVEDVELSGSEVLVRRAYTSGTNVRPAGEDFRKGTLLLRGGELIGAAEMGLIAAAGRTAVKVCSKPRVGIVATGSEVIEPFEPLDSQVKVRNTNAYLLMGLLLEAGAEPLYFGVTGDRREALRESLERALSICDIVLTSGGVSAGDYDFVKEVLPELGVEVLFYKCRVKPGKPVLFGRKGSKYLFGLPGFPVSTVVSFYSFVYPFLRKAMGCRELFKKRVKALLTSPFKRKKAERLEFVRVSYSYDLKEGVYKASPLKRQGSGVLTSLRGQVALMPVSPGVYSLPEGSEVELILIKED